MLTIEGRSRTVDRRLSFAATILVLLVLFISPAARARSEGQWYKGDLHAHSLYSDGDSPVADVLSSVEEKGLEFFALTDHDTSMNGVPVHWFDPMYVSDQVILLYGVEWTTGPGHANVWAAAPFDYEDLWQANQDENAEDAVAAAHAQGALFSINHPFGLFSSPWTYDVPADVDSVEIWNAMYRLPSFNRWAAHLFWDGLLVSGRRVPAVGGSDTHQLYGWQAPLFSHGNPTTWVYALTPDAQAILDAIAAGRTTMSYAPDAPRIDLSADVDGDGTFEAMVGDNLPAGPDIAFRAQIVDVAGRLGLGGEGGFVEELDRRTVRRLETGQLTARQVFEGRNVVYDPRVLCQVFLVGAFANGRLHRVWLLTGGADTVTFYEAREDPTYFRIEVLGHPDVYLWQWLLFGNAIGVTGPIYVGYP